jgi:hypothetical protein
MTGQRRRSSSRGGSVRPVSAYGEKGRREVAATMSTRRRGELRPAARERRRHALLPEEGEGGGFGQWRCLAWQVLTTCGHDV